MAAGIDFQDEGPPQCEHCLMGMQTKQPFTKTGAVRAEEVLELVHLDVCEPMSEASCRGFHYFLTLIDDKTRKSFIYFLKGKDEVLSKIEQFKALVENQTGKSLKTLRTDNGQASVNRAMQSFLRRNGINHQVTVEYTPEQNGVAETANRNICESARSMVMEADPSKRFWAEAVNTAVYLKNRSATVAVKGMTPEEAWNGRKVDLSHLHVLRCSKGPIDHALVYSKSNKFVEGQVDADFAGNIDDRRSFSGFVFKLANGPISF